ncbi:MAG: hypothetical protein GY950_09345, partial [bacterium]|nr:hypothetical protein [bacterium]
AEELVKVKNRRDSALARYGEILLKHLLENETDQNKKNISKTISKTARQFGLSDSVKTIDDISRLEEQFKSIRERSRGLMTAFSQYFKGGRMWLSLAAIFGFLMVLVSLGPGVGWLLAKIFPNADGDLTKISGTVAQVVTFVTAVVSWIGRRLGTVSGALDKLEDLQARLEQLKSDPKVRIREINLQKGIQKFDASILREEEKINEADRRISEAEAELQRINAGGLVYDFAKDRTKDPQYIKRLGIISVIRKDFTDLLELLEDWRKNGEDSVDRIILYIDDLDRCHPDRVVQVLQAVHLLLAVPLFNVVVAVDARWLERSLYKAYLPEAVAQKAAVGEQVENLDFSPQQYLEKIFQIPYSLPRMAEEGFRDLVDHLIITRSEYKAQISPPGETEDIPPEKDEPVPEPIPVGDGATDKITAATPVPPPLSEEEREKEKQRQIEEEKQKEEEMRKALTLEDYEQTYLQGLYRFVETPRLAKRLINIYRLIRVAAVDKDFKGFLGDETQGQYRAALVLLAINTGYPVVSTRLLRLIRGCKKVKSWSAFLKAVDPGSGIPVEKRPVWARGLTWTPAKENALNEILSHLKELKKEHGMPDDMAAYREWAEEVGRYAFHWHLPASTKSHDQ